MCVWGGGGVRVYIGTHIDGLMDVFGHMDPCFRRAEIDFQYTYTTSLSWNLFLQSCPILLNYSPLSLFSFEVSVTCSLLSLILHVLDNRCTGQTC